MINALMVNALMMPGASAVERIVGNAVAWDRLHKTAAIVEDCAMILSGKMTEWEERVCFSEQWMVTDMRIVDQSIPVGVSGGGVIRVNGSQRNPETGEAITNTYQALTAIMYYVRASRGVKP